MKFGNYIRDKILSILLQAAAIPVLFIYLSAVGMEKGSILLVISVWLCAAAVFYGTDFLKRRRYFQELGETLEALDKKYLISEVAEPSYRLEDQIYFEILHKSGKAVIEEVHRLEREKQDYKEYIEAWIHEVKTPLTVLELMCRRDGEMDRKKISLLAEELNREVEKALYYARADRVWQDYIMKEETLSDMAAEAVKRQKQLLIQNRMSVDNACGDEKVVCDRKWLSFILGQIFSNAVKYKKEEYGRIRITSIRKKDAVHLMIEDDGIGIPKAEIGRIFEKGFTGTNGRKNQASTGMGLYLCRKLCEKLGLLMEAESEEGNGTRITIVFPKSSFLSKM